MKKIIYKFLLLLVIFAVIVGGFLFINREKKEEKNIIMGPPTLPTVTLFAEQGAEDGSTVEVNELFGYTMQMETKYMRDSLTPINASRNLTVRVRNYENVIMGASYELRSLDCERLVENTQVKDENIIANGEYTDIAIQFDNLIDPDTEYYLVICLNTDRHESVYYYTRVIQLNQNYCKAEMDFVKMFSDATFDSAQSEGIISYLEPDSSEDNTNYGHVTIHSSYSQITWGELAPEKVTTPVIKIKELLGEVGCYELTYKIKALNDYDSYQYYAVTEYFRIKWNSDEIYLLDYDRTMNQIFDASNQNISAVRINLGISESEECEFISSDNNSYIAFVRQNGLWLMDIKNNQVKSLFAFQETEDEDIRDANNSNNIQLVSVDDDGNTEFVVYGYMNRGEHEGMVGVSLYDYSSKENIVEEKIFIPFTRQYGILKETMGKLSYVNSHNIMYLMLSNSVYSIDLTGSEYVEIISDLLEDNYAVNATGDIIAWETQNNGSSVIKILELESGKEHEISAGDGQILKVVGFVDNDLAYGTAGLSDVMTDGSGDTTVVMNKLSIVNIDGEVLKEYEKPGYYFTSAEISDNMINLSRVVRNEDGSGFVRADNYQIFGNEEEESNVVALSTISTDRKKKELVINFVKKVTTSKSFKNVYPDEIRFSKTNSLSIRELMSEISRYYVYGKGGVITVTGDISHAVNMAYNAAGVVISDQGNYVWARISKPASYEVTGISVPEPASDESRELAVCMNALLIRHGVNIDVSSELASGKNVVSILGENIKDKTAYDLSGCTMEQMLYYVCNGEPVLAMDGAGSYVLITGYDFYNVVLFNPQTGGTYKQGQEEASAMFSNAGNMFIVLK